MEKQHNVGKKEDKGEKGEGTVNERGRKNVGGTGRGDVDGIGGPE